MNSLDLILDVFETSDEWGNPALEVYLPNGSRHFVDLEAE